MRISLRVIHAHRLGRPKPRNWSPPNGAGSNTTDEEDVQNSPDKCVVCTRPAYGVACELCEEVSYCSDECEAVDLYVIVLLYQAWSIKN